MTDPRHRRPARSPLDGTKAGDRIRDEDIDAEVEAHLAHRVDDLVAEGLSREEAEGVALAEFGDTEKFKSASREVKKEHARQAERSGVAEATRQDLRWALRQSLRAPGFAATAVLTLLLGIGAAVTIASVVGAVVFEPLPFAEPEEIVFPEMLTPEGDRFSVSEAVFLDWGREVASFDDVSALHRRGGTLRSPGQPRSVSVTRISHNLLGLLGLTPAIGRPFAPEEDRPAMAASVALLSHAAWTSDFAADPSVVGSIVDIDGTRHEVVGVMPAALEVLTGDTPLFVPMGADPGFDRGDHYLDVVARLSPGATLEAASPELAQVQDRLSRIHSADLGWGTHILSAREVLIGSSVERAGLMLLAAAFVLLLMACVNVSNLLMVRATIRRSEMALRAALGASRARLVGQLFTESGVLALLGGSLGIVAAYLALPLVKSLGAARIPRLDTATLDGRAVLVGVLAAGVATLACGLAPAVQLRRDRLGSTMSSARGRDSDAGRLLRSFFVGGQVALTVVLLAGTGLLLRSFVELSRIDPGFEAESTVAFSMNMPDGSWDWEARAELVPQLREALASIPGVVAAGATAVEPFSGVALANFVAAEGDVPDRAADFTPIHWRVVTPGFFEAMGMELQAGRPFLSTDGWDDGTPVVIGESLARTLWSDADPIGRLLVWGDPDGSRMTVVGVVEDLRDVELDEVPSPIVYRPHRQIPWAAMTMVLRLDGVGIEAVAPAVRARIAESVPGLPIGEVVPLTAHLDRAVAEPRFNLQLLSVFAVIGLIMALVGVYGLTAFDVRRRFGEIGIRLSLGARPESIQSMILRQRMIVTMVGLVVGLAAAWIAARGLGALLYEISPRDPLTWVGVTVVVASTSLVATYLPARRATRVDPREVLNAE
ncbi:MAG: ABC transporter permease [Gemmatimonadetes bacterium]|nr:ABC transporter permease [Gemmatimonadota bacterium]